MNHTRKNGADAERKLSASNAGIPAPTAKRLLAVFKDNGLFSVLIEGRGRRNSVFALKSLLNLAEGKEVIRRRMPGDPPFAG